MKQGIIGALAFGFTLFSILWVADYFMVLAVSEAALQEEDEENEDEVSQQDDVELDEAGLDEAGTEIPDAVAGDRESGQPAATVRASFRRIESVAARGPVADADREEVDSHSFPPMRFRWDGSPEVLNSGGFLLENHSEDLIYRGRILDLTSEVDRDIATEYSPHVAIRLPDDRRLYFHYNVLGRLREWLVGTGESGFAGQLELWVEVAGENRVRLHTPAVGGEPARTLEVRY